ncbi:unnamed protein product, partial [Ceratitis capitata]
RNEFHMPTPTNTKPQQQQQQQQKQQNVPTVQPAKCSTNRLHHPHNSVTYVIACLQRTRCCSR